MNHACRRALVFGFKCAEQAIPDNQHAAVIAIQIGDVLTVMHPVMRRRVEQPFERGRQALDRFGVNPKLVQQADGLREQDFF